MTRHVSDFDLKEVLRMTRIWQGFHIDTLKNGLLKLRLRGGQIRKPIAMPSDASYRLVLESARGE